RLLRHLLKLHVAAPRLPQELERAGRGWRLTVTVQRLELAKLLRENRTLWHAVPTELVDAYTVARLAAAGDLHMAEASLPPTCTWNQQRVLNPAFGPGEDGAPPAHPWGSPRPTLTISAAARLCHCDRRTLQRAIHAGRLHLDAQHCLSREELIATGYLIVDTPQATPQEAPQWTSQDMPQATPQTTPHDASQVTPRLMPQDTPQELMQATALVALLERRTAAITALHAEVCALREDLRQMPQRMQQLRRRAVIRRPQETPQETPQPSPQILGLYDPHAAAVRIRDLRRQGLSYTLIALQLTREGIPTRYGKPWEHSSVRY